MSLEQGVEPATRLGRGSQSVVEEEEESGGELKRGRPLIIRLTHSIEAEVKPPAAGNWKTANTEYNSNMRSQLQ